MRETGHEPPPVSVREGAVVFIFGLPVETPGKTPGMILGLLRSEPGLSVPELAARIGKSDRAIERAIRKLREAGRLVRVGPDKGGHWEVAR